MCLENNRMALQNALRWAYNFALLSPETFSEFEGENSLLVDDFCKTIFDRLKFATGSCPSHHSPVMTQLGAFSVTFEIS